MEEFTLGLNKATFSSTNAAWNNLMLNDPWSVGYVTTLIELREFKNREEWESYYYETGYNRKVKLKQLPITTQELLEDEQLIRTNRHIIDRLSPIIRNLNTQEGRTPEDFYKKGGILYSHMRSISSQISLEESVECVRYRVICETWNGVIVREKNTISNLKKILPKTNFVKSDAEKDYSFGVDYEAYQGDRLLYAIQIKPKSYLWNAPYIKKARTSNEQKNYLYQQKFKVPVYYVISDSKGDIINSEVLKSLR